MNKNLNEIAARRHSAARAVLNRFDPIGLLEIGCPEDEYEPEMGGVLSAMRTASDVRQLQREVFSVFAQKFDQAMAGRFDRWEDLASELWALREDPNW